LNPTSEAVEHQEPNVQPRRATVSGGPATPVIRIGAGTGSLLVQLQECWRHRELLYFLVWRDLKVRYRQTALGVAWAILQPVLTMLLLTVFFGRLPGLSPAGVPYALYALSGLVPWMFFANAVTDSSNSVLVNPDLITKVYVPRLVVPAASVVGHLVDFAIAFALLVVLLFAYRIPVTYAILLLPVGVLLVVALTLAVGTVMAALNVRYRDIRYALPFVVQLWLFASPVIYSPMLLPERWRWLLNINPMTGILQSFRSALLGVPIDIVSIAVSTLLTAGLLLFSLNYFRRVASGFADVI
jgi:lipopolysaccharide transport system permease protein